MKFSRLSHDYNHECFALKNKENGGSTNEGD